MDIYDVPFLIENIKNDMPLFSKTVAKVKRSYSQGMPKNFKEYGDEVNEKFLDNNLATVEDFSLKYPNNELTQWFKEYQKRYFNSVLLKDSFLKIDEDGNFGTVRNYRGTSIQNVGFIGSLTSKIFGAELLTSASSSTDDAIGLTQLLAYKMATNGTVGEWYNQVAIKRGTTGSGGNFIGAIYSDSGSTAPNILLGTTASTAYGSTNSYTYTNLTNGGGALVTAITWVAFQTDAATPLARGGAGDATNLVANLSNVYGTPPSTWTGSYTESTHPFHYKCRGN